MAPISVLRIIYDLNIGGVQRMMFRLLPGLRDRGVHTHVITMKEEGNMTQRFRDAGFPVYCLWSGSRIDPMGLMMLRRLAQTKHAELIHSHMYSGNIFANLAFARDRKMKVLNSYHSQDPFATKAQARLTRLTRNVPHRVIAVSKSVAEPVLKAGIDPAKVRIVYNGVELPEAPPPLRKRSPGEPLRIVWIGRFMRQKRPIKMLEMMKALKESHQVPVHLTMVGEGKLYSRCVKRVADWNLGDCVSLAGWQTDVRSFIADADIYVSTSNREGLPNTVLEVAAQGRGMVVTDIEPNREAIGDSGCGICVPDNWEEWIAVLKRLHENRDEVARMADAAWKRAQLFSFEQALNNTWSVYEELLGARVGGRG